MAFPIFPIETIYQSGLTLYAVIFEPGGIATINVWNPTINAGQGDWDLYNSANWLQYALPMVEAPGSGYYRTSYPSDIKDTLTTDVIYIQGGVAPALGDTALSITKSQGANIAAVGSSVQAALNLGAATGSQQTGALVGTPTATVLPTDLESTTDDAYLGRVLVMTSGAAAQQVQYIVAYDGATRVISLAAPLSTIPAATDSFVII